MRFQPGNDTEQSQGHDIEDEDGGDITDTGHPVAAVGVDEKRFHDGVQCWWRYWGIISGYQYIVKCKYGQVSV